jgi:hypothetical protein
MTSTVDDRDEDDRDEIATLVEAHREIAASTAWSRSGSSAA